MKAALESSLTDSEAELAGVENENIRLLEAVAALEDRSRRMLRREMLALGILN